jgi:hypothetical protein
MGPRSDERGRAGALNGALALYSLQWGRVRMNAEGLPSQSIGYAQITEQCARGSRTGLATREHCTAKFHHNYSFAKEFAGPPRVAHHGTARRERGVVCYVKLWKTPYPSVPLYHNDSGSDVESFAEAFDSAVEGIMSRAKIDQENLVFRVVDNGRQIGAELGQLARVELAEENGELRVVAAPFEMVEHFIAPFIIGDVVADEKMPAGGHRDTSPIAW